MQGKSEDTNRNDGQMSPNAKAETGWMDEYKHGWNQTDVGFQELVSGPANWLD